MDTSAPPRIGLLISTFGSVPYVHLQLEAWRRLCSNVSVIVIDDGSIEAENLNELCCEYGVDFQSGDERSGHFVGDMKAFVKGFEWAIDNDIDLLVKFSRRWIPLVHWQESLTRFAIESQFATYSASCQDWGFRFRTEAVAMHVPSWLKHDGLGFIREYIEVGTFSIVEWVFYEAARKVFDQRCKANRMYNPRAKSENTLDVCGHWTLLGDSRCSPQAEILWHLWAKPHEYLRALLQWNITRYKLSDLEVDDREFDGKKTRYSDQ